MEKLIDNEVEVYKYVSQFEMMQHIATMSNNGYVLVSVMPKSYRVKYKKAL